MKMSMKVLQTVKNRTPVHHFWVCAPDKKQLTIEISAY
jgi:hypothetical protein